MNESVWTERFARFGSRPFYSSGDAVCTYADLRELYESAKRHLATTLPPTSVVRLTGESTPSSAAAILALLAQRAIVIPSALGGTGPAAGYESFEVTCAGTELPRVQPSTFLSKEDPVLNRLRGAGRAGLVLFTSGSSGKPKGVVHDFESLAQPIFSRPESPGRRVGTFSQLHRIAGIVQLLKALASGDCLVPLGSHDPDSVARVIEGEKVQILPATPTFLALLRRSECWKTHDLRSLTQVSYGSEPMPPGLLAELTAELSWVRFRQVYGSTEIGILRTRSAASDSLWIKIDDDSTELATEGGRAKIRAAGSMVGYLGDAHDAGPRQDQWFDTRDLAETKDGWIRIVGRDDGAVKVAGELVHPAMVEDAIRSLRGVEAAFVWAEPNELIGNMLCARVCLRAPEDIGSFRRRLWEECQEKLGKAKIPQHLEISALPVVTTDLKSARSSPRG